nr:hypothetical protein Iba_chr01aCG2330 [Ipomoea batatas]
MSPSGDERASSGGVDLRLPAAIYSSGGGVTVAPVANLWQRQYVSREQYLCLLGHQSSNLSSRRCLTCSAALVSLDGILKQVKVFQFSLLESISLLM